MQFGYHISQHEGVERFREEGGEPVRRVVNTLNVRSTPQ